MYAIVNILGQQFKVTADQYVYIHRLEGEEGSKIDFQDVRLFSDGKKTKVGAPVIAGASVSATIMQHVRADKVIVFKKKRRKGYQKQNGHRQDMTKIQIDSINA